MTRGTARTLIGTLLALALVAPPARPARAGGSPAAGAPDYEAHLAAKAPSVVTLKYLAVYGGSDEYASTCRGFVVDPTGLVMLSNENFGEGSVKIRDIKVLLGSDPKEWAGVIVARDSTLDLAYVQILDLEGKALAAIDLEQGREPRVGENLFGVTRNGRGFDYAPALRRLYVSSRIESPRLFWDFTGEFGESGLPAFDLEGTPVGVIVNQQSAEGADEGGGSHQDTFLLPLSAVSKSLMQARKRVGDVVAKAREAAKEASADAPKEPAMDAPAARPEVPKDPEPSKPGAGR